MTTPTVEELQRQIGELRQAEQQREQDALRARMQSLPVNERPIFERELRAQERERQLKAREDFLNEAALKITKKEYAAQMFIPESEFDGLESIEAITAKARTITMNLPPERLRQMAALNEALQAGTMPDPATVAAASGAPNSDGSPGAALPAGVGTATGGGTSPAGPSAAEEITRRHAGKGATDVAAWLAETRMAVPMETVIPGGEQLGLAPAGIPQQQSGAASPPVQAGALA